MGLARRRPARAPAAPTVAVLHSVLLPGIVDAWPEDRRRRVLDLGPASGPTLDTLATGPLRLCFRDVLAELAEAVAAAEQDEAGDPAAAVADLLEGRGEYDLILAWELFSHLPPAAVTAAGAVLARCLARDGVLHALVSTGPPVSRPPAAYALPAPGCLRRRAGPDPVPARVYHQHRLRGLLPDLAIERAVLLRDGMQELLLVRR